MSNAPVTLEVDLRRGSAEGLLPRLERTMGIRLTLRRARVTARRSWLLLEVVGDPKPTLARPASAL